MTDKAISPLRRRLIEDMAIRRLTDIDSDRMVIRVEQGKSLPSRKRGARRTGMSFSRPTFSICCATGGAWRARRDGWLPASAGCFLATAGSI